MTRENFSRTLYPMSFHVRRIEEKSDRRPRWRSFLVGALEIGKPLVGWYSMWKGHKEVENRKRRRVMVLKRFLLVLIAVLCALLLLVGTVKGLMSVHILSFGNFVSFAGADLPSDDKGNINLLLIGQGNKDHDGKDLTDTIIVASIDPKNSESVLLLSLPRDVYFLKTAKMGKGKLNSFYRDYKSFLRYQQGMDSEEAAVEALSEIGTEVGNNLGIEIHHTVKVNFTAFVEAVDALGGIDMDVPEDILDTEYPDENFGYETFELKKGMRHLDGETALKYARSRHSTSDFSRSERQQQLLSAMGHKAKEEGYFKDPDFITQMIHTLSENVETTMSLREMIGLGNIVRNIDKNHVISMQLNDRNALYDGFIEPGGFLYAPPRSLFDGVSVLLPVSIPEFPVTWKQPKTFVKLILNTRAAYLANPTINVLNNGAPSGYARKLATELIRYGFEIGLIANATLPEEQETSIVFAGSERKEDLAMFFTSLLNLKKTEKPSALPEDEVSDITIIIGEDYKYTPLQNLIPAS